MSKPIRQHFIPRSYLNIFSENEGDKYFIHGCSHDSNGKIIRLSTKDICVRKNLYTIPTNDDKRKFAIEHFYAENVDGVYPRIYRILTDNNIKIIDFDTRLRIVSTALSLYFRTPKFLNEQNELTEQMIRDLAKMTDGHEVRYRFLGEEIKFRKEEIASIIKEKKEKNRILFLSEHLRAYEKLVHLKLMDGICVYKLVDDSEFITSDSPVIMRPFMDPKDENFDYSILNKKINPFDVKNMIHLPLDKKHILTIMPRMDETMINNIQRLKIRKIDSLMYNYDVEKFSENWILGSKEGVENHIIDQEKFNEETPENIAMFNDYKEMVSENKELKQLMVKYGVGHEKVKVKLNKMKKNPKVTADPNFNKLVEEIEKTTGNQEENSTNN